MEGTYASTDWPALSEIKPPDMIRPEKIKALAELVNNVHLDQTLTGLTGCFSLEETDGQRVVGGVV